MNIEFGMRAHDIAGNLTDMCVTARKNGIKKLQLAPAKTVTDVDFDATGYDRSVSDRMKKELDDLEVSVLGCYINPVDSNEKQLKTSLDRFDNFISYARDLNAGVIGTETGCSMNIEHTHSDSNYKFFLNNMMPLIDKAEAMDVSIGIEPVYIYTIYSPEMMKRMIDDVKSDKLSVILDVSNITTFENHLNHTELIDKAFEFFGDRIKTIHLKDFVYDGTQKQFAPAGTGELNIRYLFDKIKQMRAFPEIILDESPLSIYKESVERLNTLL